MTNRFKDSDLTEIIKVDASVFGVEEPVEMTRGEYYFAKCLGATGMVGATIAVISTIAHYGLPDVPAYALRAAFAP